MNKTKIDYVDSSWNPVTGCRHGCEYCYARGMAERFGKFTSSNFATMEHVEDPGSTFELYEKPDNPYPFLFAPTFHRYRLNDYRNKKGRTIFICSMADLFGDWVPDEWIREVFRACEAAPQHRYLFLTKNPKRYDALSAIGELPKKHWYGHTVTAESDIAHGPLFNPEGFNNFLSIEPLLGNATNGNWLHLYKWIIVGAETGNRKGKVVPKKVWVDAISGRCALRNVPLFMKESLRGLMGEDFIQEYPWEVEG